MGYGYTVTNSIDMINEYCDNPSKYNSWQLREAKKRCIYSLHLREC